MKRRVVKAIKDAIIAAVIAVTACMGPMAVMAESGVSTWTGEERVTGFSGKPSVDGPILTWDAVPGADGYIIGGIQNKQPYRQIGYTSGTTFVAKDAFEENYSYYWVFPYKKINGKVMAGRVSENYVWGFKQLPAPQNLKAISEGHTIRLTWDPVPGADAYEVLRKSGNNPPKLIALMKPEYPHCSDYNSGMGPASDRSGPMYYWVIACVKPDRQPHETDNFMRGVTSQYVYGFFYR